MTTIRFASLVFLLAPLAAQAEAGRVVLAVGEVVAERGAARIALARGSAVESGDTIRTGPASNAQIRMSDGAIMSLRERTALRIEEHVYAGRVDGTERSFFRLLAGGIRTVTGAIGNLRRDDRYGVRTPTASIGIRGTHYTLRECNAESPCALGRERASLELAAAAGVASGAGPIAQAPAGAGFAPAGTYGGVSDGRIGVANDTGEVEFGAREFFYVADRLTPPQGLIAPPPFLYDRLEGRTRTAGQAGAETGETIVAGGIGAESRPSEPPPAPKPPEFVVSEQRTATGEPLLLPPPPLTAAVGALFDSLGPEPGDGGGFIASGDLVISGSGASAELLGFTIRPGFLAEPGGGSFLVTGSTSPGSVINETVTNALNAFWGRWTSGSITEHDATPTPIPVSHTNQFHYLVGPLAPPEVVAAKTGSFMMSVVGGTTPTNNLGQLGSFSMFTTSINFTTKMFASAGFSFAFPSQSWSFGPMSAPIEFAAGKGAFLDAVVNGTVSDPSPSTAQLGMSGIFMGPQGDHLGIGFSATASGGRHASTAKLLTCAPSC